MEGAVESGRGHWSAAIGLTFAVMGFFVLDPLALVLFPLAVLLMGLPGERKFLWVALGTALLFLAMALPSGSLPTLSRGWGLMLGVIFLLVTGLRPDWDITSRVLATVGVVMVLAFGALIAGGQATALDGAVRDHVAAIMTVVFRDLQGQFPDPERLEEVRQATERATTEVFPALLALQSLAGLALAAWWVRRLGRSTGSSFAFARLREFRFNDELIWVLIVAVILLLIPLTPILTRVAANALLFMAALYALRGLAIFVFLVSGSRSIPTMVLGAFAFVILYPVALSAALLMGVGDTWLDVRRRLSPTGPT